LVSYGQPVVGWDSVSDYCSLINTQEVMIKMPFVSEGGSEYRLNCFEFGNSLHKAFIRNGFVDMIERN